MFFRYSTVCCLVPLTLTACIGSTSALDAQATGGADPAVDAPPVPGSEEAAVRSEFEMLAGRGTVEAYELFIARHPDHPLAREAERRIDALRATQNGEED